MLLDIISWSDRTTLAIALRDSSWTFPSIVTVHLLGFGLLGGTTLLVDLRLLGIGLTTRSAADLAVDVRIWWRAALLVTVITGALLFLSEALRCYQTPPFWFKMWTLAGAVVFALTIRRRVLRADRAFSRTVERAIGLTSIALWTGVALMGRAIGFW